jgi:hypothetical protein
MRDHLAVGSAGDPQIAIQEEIAQTSGLILGVARFDVAEEGAFRFLTHDRLRCCAATLTHQIEILKRPTKQKPLSRPVVRLCQKNVHRSIVETKKARVSQ